MSRQFMCGACTNLVAISSSCTAPTIQCPYCIAIIAIPSLPSKAPLQQMWSCEHCSYYQSSRNVCELCHFPRSPPPAPLQQVPTGKSSAVASSLSTSAPTLPPPKAKDTWTCEACTYENVKSATSCSMCNTLHSISSPGTSSSSTSSSSTAVSRPLAPTSSTSVLPPSTATSTVAQPWICSACTFENATQSTTCNMCSSARPSSTMTRVIGPSNSAALSSASSSSSVPTQSTPRISGAGGKIAGSTATVATYPPAASASSNSASSSSFSSSSFAGATAFAPDREGFSVHSDSCSKQEEDAGEAAYASILSSKVSASGGGGGGRPQQWTDHYFPPTRETLSGHPAAFDATVGGSSDDATYHINASLQSTHLKGVDVSRFAEVLSRSSSGDVTLRLRVPIVWRRPVDVCDEVGGFSEGCSDPACNLLATLASSLKGSGSGGGGSSSSVSRMPQLFRSNSNGDPDAFAGFSPDHLGLLGLFCKEKTLSSAAASSSMLYSPNPSNNDWTLRRGSLQSFEIKQGTLGNCWFVSALAVVAERGDITRRLFPTLPLADSLLCGGFVPIDAKTMSVSRLAGGGAAGSNSSSSNSSGSPQSLSLLSKPDAANATLASHMSSSQRIAACAAIKNLVDRAAILPLSPLGVCQVRLCIDGLWRIVTIDDHLPVECLRGGVAYTSASRRQIWAPLIEKAVSKVVGSYAGMISGTIAEGLALLTGAPTEQIRVRTNETMEEYNDRRQRMFQSRHTPSLDEVDGATKAQDQRSWDVDFTLVPPTSVSRALADRLIVYAQSGFPMGASAHALSMDDATRDLSVTRSAAEAAVRARKESVEARGIVMNHAYSILNVRKTPRTQTLLIQLRNPWAGSEAAGGSSRSSSKTWNGAWCDGSAEWAAEGPTVAEDFMSDVNAQSEQGIFWMSLQDFLRYFSRIDVARVHSSNTGASSWQTVRVEVPLLRSGAAATQAIRIRTLAPRTEFEIALHQKPTLVAASAAFPSSPADARGGVAPPHYERSDDPYSRDLAFAAVAEHPDGRVKSYTAAKGASHSSDLALALRVTGMRYVGGCTERATSRSVGSTFTLLQEEETEILLTPISLSHFREGDVNASSSSSGKASALSCPCSPASHTLVFVIHTSAPVMVDVVEKPLQWLQKALVCETISMGERWEFSKDTYSSGIHIYKAWKGVGGQLIAVNSSEKPITFTTKMMDWCGANLIPTRLSKSYGEAAGTLKTTAEFIDNLLPKHAQFICAMSPPEHLLSARQPGSFMQSLGYSTGGSEQIQYDFHSPSLSADQRQSLHAPFRFDLP